MAPGRLKMAGDIAIYASVLLGVALLAEAGPLVPSWLLASLAAGEVAYAACAIAVARGVRKGYYGVVVLAALVLAVSLPQPQHYAFAASGEYLAFATFAAGSLLQVWVLACVPVYLYKTRG